MNRLFPGLLAAALLLTGCNNDGDGVPVPSAAARSLEITPSLGLVLNAAIKVSDADGNVVGTGITNGNGTLTLITEANGPFVVTVEGGPQATYFDEAGGEWLPFAEGTLHAVVPSGTREVGVSILTDLAFQAHRNGGHPLTDEAIRAVNESVRQSIAPGLTNILIPPTLWDASLTQLGDSDADVYALLLGALAEANQDSARPALDLLRALQADMADGSLDGRAGDEVLSYTLVGLGSAMRNRMASLGDRMGNGALRERVSTGFAHAGFSLPGGNPSGTVGADPADDALPEEEDGPGAGNGAEEEDLAETPSGNEVPASDLLDTLLVSPGGSGQGAPAVFFHIPARPRHPGNNAGNPGSGGAEPDEDNPGEEVVAEEPAEENAGDEPPVDVDGEEPAAGPESLCLPEPRKFFSDWAGEYSLDTRSSGPEGDRFVVGGMTAVRIDAVTHTVTLTGQFEDLVFAFPDEAPDYTYCSRAYDEDGVGTEQRVLMMMDGSMVVVDGIDGDDATWDTPDDQTWRMVHDLETGRLDVSAWAGYDGFFRTADDQLIIQYSDYEIGTSWLFAPAGSVVLDGGAHHLHYR